MRTSHDVDRSTRRRLRTRARLLHAARHILIEKGYDATTITDITEAADVGKGTFYLHFADKEGLTQALILEGFDELRAQVMAQRPDPADEETETWRGQAIYAIFQYAHANRDLFHIMLGGGSSAQLTQTARDYAAQVIEQVLRDEVEVGLPMRYSPALMAQIVTGAILQTVVWWLQDSRGHTHEEAAEAVLNVLRYGIQPLADMG